MRYVGLNKNQWSSPPHIIVYVSRCEDGVKGDMWGLGSDMKVRQG